MKYIKTINLLLSLVILSIPVQARATEHKDFTSPLVPEGTLRVAGFLRPPKAARPSMYWLWLNGYVNRSYLERELKQFSEKGIGGLCIFDMGARGDKKAAPPPGPAFMSDEFLENVAYALKLAGKFDFDVQLAACSSFRFQNFLLRPQGPRMANPLFSRTLPYWPYRRLKGSRPMNSSSNCREPIFIGLTISFSITRKAIILIAMANFTFSPRIFP